MLRDFAVAIKREKLSQLREEAIAKADEANPGKDQDFFLGAVALIEELIDQDGPPPSGSAPARRVLPLTAEQFQAREKDVGRWLAEEPRTERWDKGRRVIAGAVGALGPARRANSYRPPLFPAFKAAKK